MLTVRSTVTMLLGAACAVSAIALAQDPKPERKKGTIVEGTVNVYDYNPKDSGTDPDIAGQLAAIGPVGQQWYQHVMTLSNPYFEGRAPGSDGIAAAANYVEFWMRQAGLEPGFPSKEGRPNARPTGRRSSCRVPAPRSSTVPCRSATVR